MQSNIKPGHIDVVSCQLNSTSVIRSGPEKVHLIAGFLGVRLPCLAAVNRTRNEPFNSTVEAGIV